MRLFPILIAARYVETLFGGDPVVPAHWNPAIEGSEPANDLYLADYQPPDRTSPSLEAYVW